MATSSNEATDFFEEFVEAAEPLPGSLAPTVGGGPPSHDSGTRQTPTRRRWLMMAALGAAAASAVVAIGLFSWTRDEPPVLRSSTNAATTTNEATIATDHESGTSAPSSTSEPGRESGGEAPVSMVLSGERLVLEGMVESEDLSDAFFVAVSQLANGDLLIENKLRVQPGVGTQLAISLQVKESVLFDVGSAEISSEFARLLDSIASILELTPDSTILVGGHTDITGNEEINQVLSLARASAVVDYLMAHGVPAERLEAVGYGSSRPVADNSTPEGRQANRRIEIEIDMKPEDQ